MTGLQTDVFRYHRKVLLDSSIRVSRSTPALLEQLRKMNPGVIENQLHLQIQKNEPADDATALSEELLRKAFEH